MWGNQLCFGKTCRSSNLKAKRGYHELKRLTANRAGSHKGKLILNPEVESGFGVLIVSGVVARIPNWKASYPKNADALIR
jgi:hypothetical protein